jgi:hypothetical protein
MTMEIEHHQDETCHLDFHISVVSRWESSYSPHVSYAAGGCVYVVELSAECSKESRKCGTQGEGGSQNLQKSRQCTTPLGKNCTRHGVWPCRCGKSLLVRGGGSQNLRKSQQSVVFHSCPGRRHDFFFFFEFRKDDWMLKSFICNSMVKELMITRLSQVDTFFFSKLVRIFIARV